MDGRFTSAKRPKPPQLPDSLGENDDQALSEQLPEIGLDMSSFDYAAQSPLLGLTPL